MKKYSFILATMLIVLGASLFLSGVVCAEETGALAQVDYAGQPAVDSDLDALTDQAEAQLYQTDVANPDTDGDSFLDGAEVLSGTNPLDAADPGVPASEQVRQQLSRETPWAWYIARAAGLVGFVFLWLTIFLGLAIHNPWLRKIIEPIYSFDLHCFTAAMAVIFVLVHGSVLLLDPAIDFGVADVFVPFFSKTQVVNVVYLSLGILAFYMMMVMTITSYLKRYMNHRVWRLLHFLNPLAFLFTVSHAYNIGTDLKNALVASIFSGLVLVLVLIYLSSLIFALWTRFRVKKDVMQ